MALLMASARRLEYARTPSSRPIESAPDHGKNEQGSGCTVEADAAGLHHHQLAVFRLRANGHERAHQHGEGYEVIHELRRCIPKIAKDGHAACAPFEQMIGKVYECCDIKERQQGGGRQRRHAEPLFQHIPIEDAQTRHGKVGNFDAHQHPVESRRGCTALYLCRIATPPPEKRQRKAHRLFRRAELRVMRTTPQTATSTFGTHIATHANQEGNSGFSNGFRQVIQHPVDKDDADAQYKACQPPIATVADAHSQSHEHERDTLRQESSTSSATPSPGYAGRCPASETPPCRFELGDGHFGVALHGPLARKYSFRIDRQHGPVERREHVFLRFLDVDAVPGTVLEHQRDRALASSISRRPLFAR